MYRERGNASSASIGGVIERGRLLGGRKCVAAVAFGPGVTVEMVILRRRQEWRGRDYAAGMLVMPNGVDKVFERDQSEQAELVVAEAQAKVFLAAEYNGLKFPVNNAIDRTNGVATEKEQQCVCVARSLRFGGSGMDCWCRS